MKGYASPALNTGERSDLFWQAMAEQQRAIVVQVIQDQGFAENDAPEALRRVADTLAEAVLLKASAFQRVAEAGGPLTASDRGRRAFDVWERCAGKVITATKQLGLKRVPKPAASLADVLAQHEDGRHGS
jgi:hypothetical protein